MPVPDVLLLLYVGVAVVWGVMLGLWRCRVSKSLKIG
jgi:hypothetical protein